MAGPSLDLDVTKAQKSLGDLQKGITAAGKTLDVLNEGAQKGVNAVAKSIKESERNFEKLTQSIRESGKSSQQTETLINNLAANAKTSFMSMATASQNARIQLEAYASRTSDLGKMLRATDSYESAAASQKKLNLMVQQAVQETRYYEQALAKLSSAELKGAAAAKSAYKDEEYLLSARRRTASQLAKAKVDLEQATSAQGRLTASIRAAISAANALNSAETKQRASKAALIQEINFLNSAAGKETLALKAQLAALKSTQAAQQADVRVKISRAEATARLARELAFLQSAAGREQVLLRQSIAAERKAITASAEAHIKRNRQLNISNQLTAAMRATLGGLQTSIGMYTSSTILAASAAYGLARAIKSTITTGAEFQTTMARTKSIMGGSVPDSFKTETFDAMGARIRAVAKGIQFTATEVAQAVTELGQAGLTAGQAMSALAPTLDLAIIGNIGTAQAADHATNIMMIFGKEAADLTGIVDVMAKAVTSSNTNVDQLANALTYAGPAADTLGLSLQETTAAVATLANAGFKASRAGTALRRLFVSLSAPTKKGQAVLDQFNVSVTDLKGNTKGLTDIVQQLARGMNGLTDVEKLAAVKDLVGVYASSPIAALIKQADGLENMNLILKRAGGEAAKMRAEIEASLTFDYKTALSAFQEVQLTLFDQVGTKLQHLTMLSTEWLSSLTVPLEEGSVVTQLSLIIDRFEQLTKIGGAFIALWAGKKALGVLGAALVGMGRGLSLVTSQTMLAVTGVRAFGASSLLSGTQVAAATMAYRAQTAELTRLSGAMLTAAVIARGLGTALALVSTVGTVIYAAYTIFDMLFTDKEKERVEANTEAVKDYARSYLEVKRNMQLVAEAEAKKATDNQLGIMERTLANLQEQKVAWLNMQQDSEAKGLDTTLAKEEIRLLDSAISDLKTNIRETFKATKGLVDPADVANIDKMREGMAAVSSALSRVSQEQFKLNQWGLTDTVAAEVQAKLDTAKANLENAKKMFNTMSQGESSAIKTHNALLLDSAVLIEKGAVAAAAKAEAMKLTDFDKHIAAEREQITNMERYAELSAAIAAQKATPADWDEFEKLTKTIVDANEALVLGRAELENYGKSIEDLMLEIDRVKETDGERYARLKIELAEVIRLSLIQKGLMDHSNPVDATLAADAYVKLLKERLKLEREVYNFEKPKTAPGRGGKKEKSAEEIKAEKIKEAASAYESLRQKYDQVAVSAEKLAKITEQLTYLKANDAKFTEENYIKALQQARKEHHAVVLAQDKQLQTMNKLRESYMVSGIQKQVDDLAALEIAYAGVTEKGAEYARIRERILKSARPADGPKAQFAEPTGPFSEFLSASVTQSNDLQTYDKGAKGLIDNHQLGDFGAQDKFAKAAELQMQAYADQQMSEAAHLEEMAKLGRTYEQDQLANTAAYNDGVAGLADQRAQYQEQSSMLVLASMAGSLSSMLGMIAKAGEDATGAQKVAFVAQKALAVAQILIQTHVAAALVKGQTGMMGIGLDSMIMAQGYASAGLVSAMAIGELSGGGSSGGGSNYAGAYDKGGYIPTGKHGIVGEYGPEIVNGPAHVTGREATARKLGGGDGAQSVTIAPVIQIEYKSEGGGGEDGSRKDAAMIANTVKMIVIDTMKNEMRPNGLLYRS